jgi:hypothetical protein
MGPRKAHHVALFPGGYLRFDDLDFGPQAAALRLTLEFIPAETPPPPGATLELRLDHPKGPLLASVNLSTPPDEQGLLTVTTTPIEALHTLYFLAVGPIEITPPPIVCRLFSFRFAELA